MRAPAGSLAACDACLRRAWLLARLSGHLEPVRNRVGELLALDDDELIAAVAGRQEPAVRRDLGCFDASDAARTAIASGTPPVCRCATEYPAQLRDLGAPPAVLFVTGDVLRLRELAGTAMVAIVGSRRGSSYGLEIANGLARGLGRAGVPIVSGMALGIDCAAHDGALSVDAPTIAVLPGPASEPYPPGRRATHRAITRCGVAVSEVPPGTPVRRWSFPARNRVIAALAAMTVIVEAGARSGALLTAAIGSELGRMIGAVPGRVGNPLADGPNDLLAAGARIIRGPQDVLDALYGVDAPRLVVDRRPPLTPRLRALADAIAAGGSLPGIFTSEGLSPERVLRCSANSSSAVTSGEDRGADTRSSREWSAQATVSVSLSRARTGVACTCGREAPRSRSRARGRVNG